MTVAKEIELNISFKICIDGAEVASKTNDMVGDGTTTATVLAQSLIHGGAKVVAAGMNPMDLKRGIDLAVDKIVAEIKTLSKGIKTNEEVAQAGTISANGEKEVGAITLDNGPCWQ